MSEAPALDVQKEDPRELSILGWLDKYQIKNEKGELITFEDHLFLLDIYEDQSPNLVVMKAAQVGLSTLEILKNAYDAHRYKMDIIYTLPTDSDVSTFVGGKVNRIIQNNPILQQYTNDKDSIEQKQIGQSMLYFRGTFTKKAANMVTADRLVHDEKDSSKQEVVSDYQARMQHSKYKQTHVFSHPSVPGNGVDVEWNKSDQKEWFITCPHCGKEQFLSWNTEDPKKMSVDIEKKIFICKKCHGELSRRDRAIGRWVKKYKTHLPGKVPVTYSGYHITWLMCPWVTAAEVIDKHQDRKAAPEYFNNKVLGLTYSGSGNVVIYETLQRVIDPEPAPDGGRIVIGVDTGIALRYVIGNKHGLMGYGEMAHYEARKKTEDDPRPEVRLEESLEYFLKKFPNSVMVIDQGGDITGSRSLRQKYPGRVFLCHYSKDRKTMQLIRWGDGDESGNVLVDRNRMMQLVVDEMREKRFKLMGAAEIEWYDYWLHWSHIYRTREEDSLGIMQSVWHRSDRDDWVHATVYWRVALNRFGSSGAIVLPGQELKPNSYMVNANRTADFNPEELFHHVSGVDEDEGDWRD